MLVTLVETGDTPSNGQMKIVTTSKCTAWLRMTHKKKIAGLCAKSWITEKRTNGGSNKQRKNCFACIIIKKKTIPHHVSVMTIRSCVLIFGSSVIDETMNPREFSSSSYMPRLPRDRWTVFYMKCKRKKETTVAVRTFLRADLKRFRHTAAAAVSVNRWQHCCCALLRQR